MKPAILQTEVHPHAQEKELKEFLAKENIVIQAWYPLGHGDAALNQEKHYYTSTPEILQKYVEMVPPVDTQK